MGRGLGSRNNRAVLATQAGCEADCRRCLRRIDRAAPDCLSRRHDCRGDHKTMTQPQISDTAYAVALALGQAAAQTEIRALAVRYIPERDAIEIVTTRNAGFLVPRQWIGALQEVPIEDLAKLEIWPDGSAIELEERDIHISVHGLMMAVLPAMLPARAVAGIFASRGGKATSEAKRSSAQTNGRKGGRPPKPAGTAAA